jgi:hypothetical protein
MKTLGERQREFPLMVAALITWAYENGYEISFGEARRSDEQAELNAMGARGREELARRIEVMFPALAAKIRNNTGSGIRNSLHEVGLAVDLNLFRDGKYLASTEDHLPLGKKWEEIGGTWGGRFGDGNHYSLEFGGRK